MSTEAAALPRSGLKVIERSDIHRIQASYMAGKKLNILEAGCGRKWPFDKGEHTITGVDIDPSALAIRKNERKDLDFVIEGDLRTVSLPFEAYDVIYSSFVLEHIHGAESVLNRFVEALKPGGVMLLTFPDRDGVYGFFTRVTPFWFHVFYKKHIEHIRNAGKPGHEPYPTFHDKVIARRAFLEYAAENGLSVLEEYGFGNVPNWIWTFIKLVGALSMGRLASDHVNLMYVLQKDS